MFRWWWPAAAVDHTVIASELAAVAAAGYRGVEIAAVYGIGPNRGVDYPVDPDEYGFGTPRWNAAIEFATTKARELGLVTDVCMGPQWNVSVPGLDVDGPASVKEVVFGAVAVRAGTAYSGNVPAPAPRTYTDRTFTGGSVISTARTATPTLIAVQAAIRTAGTPDSPVIDVSTVVDVTSTVVDGTISWTPPDNRDWALIGVWYRGTSVKPDLPFSNLVTMYSDPEPRCIDYFGRAGVEAFIEHFEATMTRTTAALLKNGGGVLFDDSIEIARGGIRIWTPEFLPEFQARRGYDLRPYILSIGSGLSNGDVARRVKRDVDQTLSDLYIERHLAPFQAWTHSLGLRYQAQPYQTTNGVPIDLAYASSLVDVPEGENFDFTTRGSEDWRVIASGADLGGRGTVSDEYRPGAGLGWFPYESTPKDLVEQANGQFALGVTQLRMVGIPYPHYPTSIDGSIRDDHTRWPGFHPIGTIPEAMGPRNPTWSMASDISGYFSRTQQVLKTGTRRTDLAIYTQVFGLLLNPADRLSSPALLQAGYTYGYVSPGTLGLKQSVVSNGRLAPDGPAFKALIIDNEPNMPLDTLKRIVEYANAGLPTVFIGNAPSESSGYAATANIAAQRDGEFRAAVDALLGRRNVYQVGTTADLPGLLGSLGIAPHFESDQPWLRAIRRDDGDVTYYFIHNSSSNPVKAAIKLDAPTASDAYLLDAWNGEHWALDGRRQGNTVAIELEIARYGAAMIAVAKGWQKRPYVPLTAPSVGAPPAPLALEQWDIEIDDWQPATAGQPSSAMNVVRWRFPRTGLRSWSDIPEITNAAGIGTYSASFTLPENWDSSVKAYLDLGTVEGSFRVRVNGEWIGPADQLTTRVDIGTRLLAGTTNKIEVDVASSLINRVRTVQPAYAGRDKKALGLIGPVTLHSVGRARRIPGAASRYP